MGVVFHNSAFINEEDLIIKGSNRAFNYGDGFFESIKIINSKPFNFSAHYARFSFASSVLKFKNHETESSLLAIISELIKQNKLINGSVKIHINRSEGGKYLPDFTTYEIIISSIKSVGFTQNVPTSLCVFSDEVKTKGKLANIKSVNALVSVIGAIYANELGFENAILKNIDSNCIETTNSNIFVVKAGVIYSPPLSDGCVDGTMRNWVLKQDNVIEKSLTINDIKGADQVFVANAIAGITAVNRVEEISFSDSTYANELQNKLISLSSDL